MASIRGIMVVSILIDIIFNSVAAVQETGLGGLMQEIPLLQNKFYIQSIVTLLLYLDVAVLLVSLGMIIVGRAVGGDRSEGAEMFVKGKKIFTVALISLLILAALPVLIKFFLRAGSGSTALANQVPTW